MKRLLISFASIAMAFAAIPAKAVGLQGAYNYQLVLRDQYGYAIGYEEGGSVSDYYTFAVYNSAGTEIYTQSSTSGDRTISSTAGCNYLLSVCTSSDKNNPVAHYAVPGEQLTLVVKSEGTEVFRSSKILPPIEWSGSSSAPIGVFYADSSDTDGLYDKWADDLVNPYCNDYNGDTIGGKNDDYDTDELTNLREYQFGTDPTGSILVDEGGFVNKPDVSIEEQEGDVIKVSFNYGFNHVYSVRAIEGTQTYGVDGQDLALYDSLANLNAGTSSGKYFYDGESWESGSKTYYVKKPTDINGTYMIGLAVDGRLMEYITVGSSSATYAITWLNDDGTEIETTQVEEGETPSHADAAKAGAEVPYVYTFAGWTPAIEAAESNTTYTATFTKVADLTQLTGDWTATDGDTIVNTTAHAVTIPSGASVTVNGVCVKGAAGASIPDPEFATGGTTATTKFEKTGDKVWTLTTFAEMDNDSIGANVDDAQIKVYAAESLSELETATPMTSGVTVTEKKSAVKTTIEIAEPASASGAQFFKVEFGE